MTATEDPQSLVNRIIAELEARPEVKPALLRALLTDEFLLLPSKVDRLMELVPAVETLQEEVAGLQEGQARLEEGQARLTQEVAGLQEGQARLTQEVAGLQEGQARLTQEVAGLKAGQARLTQEVAGLQEGQARLEEGQVRLNAGQNRMGGELSSLTGSQYQRHVTEIGKRLVRREMGIHDPRLLHADLAFGARMAEPIGDEAEAEGRITKDENDELLLSDVILVGVDEAGQPVQALLEVSLTVQQSDIERAQARARILEKATGIRTLAGVVGESIPEEEQARAQEGGVTCFTVRSGLPPR